MGRKRGVIVFSLIGILAVMCGMAVSKLSAEGNIIWDRNWILYLAGWGVLGGSLLGSVVFGLLSSAEPLRVKLQQYREQKRKNGVQWSGLMEAGDKKSFRSGLIFAIAWGAMFLCWLPAYLAYYPAICSYDMTIQLGQILERAYNDHHPIFHTLMIQGFMELGERLGNVNWGIGWYAFLQMAVLSAAMAAGVWILAKRGVKRCWLILLILYGCLFPFHQYMSISVTKDTYFTAFVLLFLLLLSVISEKGRNTLTPGLVDLGYLGSAVGLILFRSNGKYALLVVGGFLGLAVLLEKQKKKLYLRILAETAAAFLIGSALLSGIFRLTDAGQGDRREMLSMPIQQLARVMVYHSGEDVAPEDDHTLDEASKALLNDFMLNESWKQYRPDIADPVKRHTNTYVARYRAKEFVQTYVRLFLRYPGEYVNAVLATNAGYLSPIDESHAVINVNGRDRGLGYIQTRWVEGELNPAGIYKDSKWEWLHERLEEFADSNGYLQIPVLKYLMVPGVYLWLYLILAAWLWYRKQYQGLIPLAFVLGYYLTLFLGPTVQLRYLYPLMVALPYLAVLVLTKKSKCG